MQNMTPDEYRQFMTAGHRTGKLATVGRDGRPHVVPIWFVLEGDDLVFTVFETTVKYHNLRRDPRAALCVDDDAPPFSFVMVQGTVTISDPPTDEKRVWTTRLARRYMGDELAESYGKRNAVPGELLVRLTPDHIVAQKDLAE